MNRLDAVILMSDSMKRILLAAAGLALPVLAWAAAVVPDSTLMSTVVVANYTEDGSFVGWGSGFFVDDTIVVTNKHVVARGDWYRVYATNPDRSVNFECFKKVTKSDVKLNLQDDVAYIRVFLPCDHGVVEFGDDPQVGDTISVIGYPYKGGSELMLTVTSGSVLGRDRDGWMYTDAHLDIGNSGGPVVNEDGTQVRGVAVAKGTDETGQFVVGFFIPSSVIVQGLLYANDSDFGYTPQSSLPSYGSSSSSSVSSSSSSSSSSRSSSSQSFSTRSRIRSSVSSQSSARTFSDVSPLRTGFESIESLVDRGIITGYGDGTFRPDAGINRAEFIKLLVAGFQKSALMNETNCFSDVHDEWFAQYVCAAKRLGWVNGYSDGSFGPDRSINRAEAMKILVIAFGGDTRNIPARMPTDVRTAAWYYTYVAAGVRIGIVDPFILFKADRLLTREIAAMWIDGSSK